MTDTWRHGDERRGVARRGAADEPWTVSLRRPGPDSPTIDAVALDLSPAGTRLRVPAAVAPGECILLELHSPVLGARFRLAARVRWVMNASPDAHVAGLDFNEFAGDELARWVAWAGHHDEGPDDGTADRDG